MKLFYVEHESRSIHALVRTVTENRAATVAGDELGPDTKAWEMRIDHDSETTESTDLLYNEWVAGFVGFYLMRGYHELFGDDAGNEHPFWQCDAIARLTNRFLAEYPEPNDVNAPSFEGLIVEFVNRELQREGAGVGDPAPEQI